MKPAPPLRILLVEDSPADAELAQLELGKAGLRFEARRVEGREDFLAAIESFAPTIVISEYSLPRLDGMTALGLSLEREPARPVIILTASKGEQAAVRCIRAGASDFVAKEDIARLPLAVEEALEGARAALAGTGGGEGIQRSRLIQAEKLASIGTLVAGAAHEINNPNHTIMLNMELLTRVWRSLAPLLDRRFADEGDTLVGGIEYRELRVLLPNTLQSMKEAAERIDGIVRGLKDFASPEEARGAESLDLNLVVRSAVSLIRSQIAQATSRFELRLGEDLPRVMGRFQRLEQVLVNLLLNSCQSLEGQDRGLFVETAWEPEASLLRVEVVDEGRGMGEEELSRVKLPFYTTRRAQGGTGLGISISNAIIEEHGGTLGYASAPGRGTRATILLPIAMNRSSEVKP